MRKGANIGERLNLCVTKGGAFAATTDHRQSVPNIAEPTLKDLGINFFES